MNGRRQADGFCDGASLFLTTHSREAKGEFSSPSEELSFRTFAAGLSAHALAYARMKK